MSLLARLFSPRENERDGLKPLWHSTVKAAREPDWYTTCGVADTLEGRFDMVTSVLTLVLLRMEGDPQLAAKTGLLTELFVQDMDGQLRQSGVGDLVVGKKIGRLMEVLGGRLGAYRTALASDDEQALVAAVRRNTTLAQDDRADALARNLRGLHRRLATIDSDTLLDDGIV